MFNIPPKPTVQTLKVPGRIDMRNQDGMGDGELALALPQLIGLIRDDIKGIVSSH